MESSNIENCATKFVNDLFFWNYKFVNDLERIEEKAAAGGDEVGEGEEIEEVEGQGQEKAGGGEGGGENKDEDYWRYIPLFKAALRGDWDSAKRFFAQHRDALTAPINSEKETALHVTIQNGRSIKFVKKLVDLMRPEELAVRNFSGQTALYSAAKYGNTKAAVILVKKHPASLYIRDNNDKLPVHTAANNGHKDTLLYLLSVTKDDPESKPFAGRSGAMLLFRVVDSEFFDIALDLVGRYPELATSTLDGGGCALKLMARNPSAFPSGIRLNRWERLIYYYVLKLENYADQDHNRSDIENPVNSSQLFITQKHSWARISGANFPNSVPHHIKHVQKQKLMHLQAIQLVKSLCEKIRSSNDSEVYKLFFKDVILIAARYGIHEVVEEVVESFPEAMWHLNKDKCNIFGLAVIHRCENVFNLIYQMSGNKQDLMFMVDKDQNNVLHLAGRLAPFAKRNLVPGAALQMQRELQWFKEVEKFVSSRYKQYENNAKEIPSMVFTKEHEKLVEEGGQWMKDTANSCTIAAALIATIAFAAVITVPGGNNGTNGVPVLSKANAFIVFIISDAISLFTSTVSLLMFLSILTSRYAEGDFFIFCLRG